MIVDHVVVGPFQENAWVVGCESTGEGILVDPGDEVERIVQLVVRLGVTPLRIVNTHGHLDHIGAVEPLRQRFGIPFSIHPGERGNLQDMAKHAAVFGLAPPPRPQVDHWIEDGEVFAFGEESLTALTTPGHTAGGTSFTSEGVVFVGDTLFFGSIGRTDLPGGDLRQLRRSIEERLFALPEETIVHCGHGPDTTIGREGRENPFVRKGEG